MPCLIVNHIMDDGRSCAGMASGMEMLENVQKVSQLLWTVVSTIMVYFHPR